MAMLLLNANGTVTVCHSKTRDLAGICRRADILVCAVGKPRFVTSDMIKPGAAVIDVGINRLPTAPSAAMWTTSPPVRWPVILPRPRRRGPHDHRHAAAKHPAQRGAGGGEISGAAPKTLGLRAPNPA